MTQDSKGSATETALRLLSQRSLSERELRQRLEKREYAGPAIEAALEAMRGYNYLDDARLAESVRVAAARRGKGPRWIQATLYRRGIGEALAQEASQVDAATQTAQAREVLAQRFKDGLPDARTRQRAYRLLCSRGFNPRSVMDALGRAGDTDFHLEEL
jgi:regulatory protein